MTFMVSIEELPGHKLRYSIPRNASTGKFRAEIHDSVVEDAIELTVLQHSYNVQLAKRRPKHLILIVHWYCFFDFYITLLNEEVRLLERMAANTTASKSKVWKHHNLQVISQIKSFFSGYVSIWTSTMTMSLVSSFRHFHCHTIVSLTYDPCSMISSFLALLLPPTNCHYKYLDNF